MSKNVQDFIKGNFNGNILDEITNHIYYPNDFFTLFN